MAQVLDQPGLQKAYTVIDSLNAHAITRRELMKQHEIDWRINRNLLLNLSSLATSVIGAAMTFMNTDP